MAKKRKVIEQRRTILVVGEGSTEVAFLKYLRGLYCSGKRGPKVTIKNAHGKGPENIVDYTQRCQRNAMYDRAISFLDTDIPWSQKLKKTAKSAKIELIGNSPCIEGRFLLLLGHVVPKTSDECKNHLKNRINHNLLRVEEYEHWCSLKTLENMAENDPCFNKLLNYFK